MADKIVVLRAGIVEQVGAPLELYDTPANTFVATFIGSPAMNMFTGDAADGTIRIFEDFAAPLPQGVAGESEMTMGLRPDAVIAAATPSEGAFPAKVVSLEATGSETMLFADKNGQEITIVTKERLSLKAGDDVWLTPDLTHGHFFGADGRRVN